MKSRFFFTFSFLVIGTVLVLLTSTTQGVSSQIGNTSTSKSLYERLANDSIQPLSANQLNQSTSTWDFQEVFSFDLAEFWCENNIAVADFDRDGLTDIILLGTTTYQTQPPYEYVSKVVLLHNEGNWQFSNSIIAQYPVNSYGYGIQATDLNNDGWDDFVLREQWSTHVFLNNQTGGFSESWTSVTGAFGGLDLSDVNNDNYVDLLSGIHSGSGAKIEVFLNNGSGTGFNRTWESPLYGDSAGVMRDVFATNSNGDNNADIIGLASQIDPDLLTIFSGNGTGNAFTEENVLDLGDRAYSLAVGKIDNNNLTDLATHVDRGEIHVFQAQGNNAVTDYWQSPDLDQIAFNLALADFDQDGFDDVFAGTFGDGALRIYRNNPGTDFELVWSSSLLGFGYAGTVADLDDDGYPELIVGDQDSNGQNTIRILHRIPTLNINYSNGAPGSFFTITGAGFPTNTNATITINGRTLGTVSTDATGELLFLLSTTNADEGTYFITASVNPNATTSFVLDSAEPIRSQEDNGTIFDVPSGIAFTEFIFLPTVLRE